MRLTKKQQEETVKVTCYGKTKAYKRKDAIAFFREGMLCCDPESSEFSRYEHIHSHLMAGALEVSDEDA